MTMTLEDRAKLAVHELRTQFPGPDAQTDYLLRMLRLAVTDEREACAKTAEEVFADPAWHPDLRGGAGSAAAAIRARPKDPRPLKLWHYPSADESKRTK